MSGGVGGAQEDNLVPPIPIQSFLSASLTGTPPAEIGLLNALCTPAQPLKCAAGLADPSLAVVLLRPVRGQLAKGIVCKALDLGVGDYRADD